MTDFALKTLKPSKTEALRFMGRLIAEIEWTTRAGEYMRFEIWETEGGAYIPVIEGSVPGAKEKLITAEVVERIYKPDTEPYQPDGSYRAPEPDDIDRKAMHIAVLRFFEGHDRARSMIRSQLKWNCIREVL